jgi:hypothetical protein
MLCHSRAGGNPSKWISACAEMTENTEYKRSLFAAYHEQFESSVKERKLKYYVITAKTEMTENTKEANLQSIMSNWKVALMNGT